MKIVGFSPSEAELASLGAMWSGSNAALGVFGSDMNAELKFSRSYLLFNAEVLMVTDKSTKNVLFQARLADI